MSKIFVSTVSTYIKNNLIYLCFFDVWIDLTYLMLSITWPGYHLSCTCAMGKVVDAEGRVKGVETLRVADASIMPSMTSGNLNAPTIMMAELLADRIRGETPLLPEAWKSWAGI